MNLQSRIDRFLATHQVAEVYARRVNHFYTKYLTSLGLADVVFTDHDTHHLVDRDGNRYLDLVAGYGACYWGRAEFVRDAARQALELRMPSLVQFSHSVLGAMLAEALVSYAGGDFDRVFFTNGGAESTDYALKMARMVTGRSRMVCFTMGYHGLTLGALGVNGSVKHQKMFGVDGPAIVLPLNDAEALTEAFRRHGREIAGVIVEPVVARTGEVASAEFMRLARALCDQYGSLLICDEIKTGFGRTGKPFCYQWSGVVPDIITVAKGLSGGVSAVGAVLSREHLYRKVFDSIEKIAVYSSTFKENHVAMAVGLAVLDAFDRQPGIYDHVKGAEALVRQQLATSEGSPVSYTIGGRGLVLTIGASSAVRTNLVRALVDKVEGDAIPGILCRRLFAEHRILVSLPNRFGASVALIPALDLPHAELGHFTTSLRAVAGEMATESNWRTLREVVADARAVL